MQIKRLTAGLLLAFSGIAHAQSSVTLYGTLDAGLMYQSTSAASFSPKAANLGSSFRYQDGGVYSSTWGIRGQEDLGGGYAAIFQLQGVFNSGNGGFRVGDTPSGGDLFSAIADVGLTGPFGSLTMGRQIVPMFYAMVDTDVRSGQYFGSSLMALEGLAQAAGWPGTSTNQAIGAVCDDNALVYQSPSFHGASFQLEYAPGGVAGQIQGGTRESAVLRYSNYGLTAVAAYYNAHDASPFVPTGAATYETIPATGYDNNRFYYLGAKYRFHGFMVSAAYGNGRNPSHVDQVNINMYSVGLGYQFSPMLQVTSGFYYLKDMNVSASRSAEVAVGVQYSLSKQTLVYAQFGHVDNRGGMTQMIMNGDPVAPGMSTSAIDVGLRHTF